LGNDENERAFHAAFTFDDNIYVWGGGSNMLESFSFLTRAWTEVPTNSTPPNLYAFGYSYITNYLYVYGGILDNGEINDVFYVLSLTNLEWSILTPTGITLPPLIAPSLYCEVDYCFVSGGMDNVNVYSSIYRIDHFSFDGVQIGDLPEPRFGGVSLEVDDEDFVYAFGMNNEWITTHSTYIIDYAENMTSTVEYQNSANFPDGKLHPTYFQSASMEYFIFGGSMRTDPWTYTASPTIWFYDIESSDFNVVSCYPGSEAINTICIAPTIEIDFSLVQENYVSSLIDNIVDENFDFTPKTCC